MKAKNNVNYYICNMSYIICKWLLILRERIHKQANEGEGQRDERENHKKI